MRRGMAVLAVAAALTGCSGSDEAASAPRTRAHLHAVGEAPRCGPVTARRLERQPIAFSGTLRLERPNRDNPDHVDWAIDVDHWYSDPYADVMVLHGSDVALQYFSDDVADGSGAISEGDRLLVAGPNRPRGRDSRTGPTFVGTADSCLTRRWSEDLAEQYERAFPG